MRVSLRWLLPAGAIVAALALVFAWMTASGTSAKLSANTTAQPALQSVCPPATATTVTCYSIYRTPGHTPRPPGAHCPQVGCVPLTCAVPTSCRRQPPGAGRTVAIVDAFNDPKAAGDLAVYRKTFGLRPCTVANHCFRKVNQTGGTRMPAPSTDWAEEISLDLDMVSAICPRCHILLVESSSATPASLAIAENTAVRLGARYVSNSYGIPESALGAARVRVLDRSYNHPGVAVTVSSGDSGFGVNYPASSRYVTAVGGTSLLHAHNARGWAESAWSFAGSGCSALSGKPAWQFSLSGCRTHRTVADVSADADPQTGVYVYNSYSFRASQAWEIFGGTSAAAPMIAATYALAGVPKAHTYPAAYPYHHLNYTKTIYDAVGGSNGSCSPAYLCTGVRGYDGPTGLGAPHGTGAFRF